METGTRKTELTLWIAAAAVAALATGIMFDASPGANWGVWTSVAAFGLLPFSRHAKSPTLVGLAIAASIIAFGAAITASDFLQFLIFVSVVMLLALEMLLSPNPLLRRLTPTFAVPAPVVAFVSAIIEAARRGSHALQLVQSERARSVLRGLVITVPVVIIFALLLATADPIFARWRDAIERIITNWEFLPRTIFFFGMLTIVLGAYGFASREHAVPANPVSATPPRKWLGATERLILLASVAALFWIFLAVQLSYLFGNSAPGRRIRHHVRGVCETWIRRAERCRLRELRADTGERAIWSNRPARKCASHRNPRRSRRNSLPAWLGVQPRAAV